MPGYVKVEKLGKICLVCGRPFAGLSFQKYCSYKCAKEKQDQQLKERTIQRRMRRENGPPKSICKFCEEKFVSVNGSQFCSDRCRLNAYAESLLQKQMLRLKEKPSKKDNAAKEIVPHEERPYGKYVYGWYHPGESLPFYIGQGVGNRAWVIHRNRGKKNHKRYQAYCEVQRTKDTRVVIYRSNLTTEGALLVESVLIVVFRSLGARLTNQVDPLRRKEEPPLEQYSRCLEYFI